MEQNNQIFTIGGNGEMPKKAGGIKTSKTPDERFALKVDKIISTLIQMKPLCDNPDKKKRVYLNLKEWLEYQQEIGNNV